MQLGKEAGLQICLDMASYNIVEGDLEFFDILITKYVDIVFANEEEAKAYTGKDAWGAINEIASKCSVVIVKLGAQGSCIKKGTECIKLEVPPVKKVVDTTGAGDYYAAADLRNNGRFPFPEHCLGNAKLSCIIQVILRLPVMHTAAKHIDLLLHSTGICCIHLHRHAKHKRRNDHSGTDQHNMMFLFGPFSEVLMHLQSHLPELPSLVGRTLSWRNGSLPSAPQLLQ